MSADNGIYVLRTVKWPTKEGSIYLNPIENRYEYRVAHCAAIDNLDWSDLYMPIYFSESKVFSSVQEAWTEAKKMEESIGWTEYGMFRIEKETYFPNITKAACEQALDCFVGAEPIKTQDEIFSEVTTNGGVILF